MASLTKPFCLHYLDLAKLSFTLAHFMFNFPIHQAQRITSTYHHISTANGPQ